MPFKIYCTIPDVPKAAHTVTGRRVHRFAQHAAIGAFIQVSCETWACTAALLHTDAVQL